MTDQSIMTDSFYVTLLNEFIISQWWRCMPSHCRLAKVKPPGLVSCYNDSGLGWRGLLWPERPQGSRHQHQLGKCSLTLWVCRLGTWLPSCEEARLASLSIKDQKGTERGLTAPTELSAQPPAECNHMCDPRQNQQHQPAPGAESREITNQCCFKPLNFRVVC